MGIEVPEAPFRHENIINLRVVAQGLCRRTLIPEGTDVLDSRIGELATAAHRDGPDLVGFAVRKDMSRVGAWRRDWLKIWGEERMARTRDWRSPR
jgi:hypothetical protein